MFRQILLSILLLLLLLVATAGATDVNGEYIIFGSGTWSCQEAVRKATQDDPMWHGMLVGWLGGYLTATHYQMDTTYALTLDFNSAYAWMMDYCRRNPVEKVSQAARELLWTLYPHRFQDAPTVSLPPPPRTRPTFPALPQWEQPDKPSIPVQKRKRS